MPKMYFKKPEFNYGACEQFTKSKESIQEFKETEIKNIFSEIN